MPSVNTRRELLSAFARSFDPLGICLPVLTFAKILFQSTSTSRTLVNSDFTPLGWDDPLPNEILTKWNMFANELHLLSQISIERCFRPDSFPLIDSTITLLVFSDASLAAFGAVAYLRTSCDDRDHLSFVMEKGRIAPTSRGRPGLVGSLFTHRSLTGQCLMKLLFCLFQIINYYLA
jgi:hypothetical protein